jgi:hypothetical protein
MYGCYVKKIATVCRSLYEFLNQHKWLVDAEHIVQCTSECKQVMVIDVTYSLNWTCLGDNKRIMHLL